eukprot:5993610-Pleurochrysis_carterae.AAC.3
MRFQVGVYVDCYLRESGDIGISAYEARDSKTLPCYSFRTLVFGDSEHRVAWCADGRPALRLRHRAGQVPARDAPVRPPPLSTLAWFLIVSFSLTAASRDRVWVERAKAITTGMPTTEIRYP